MLLSLFYALLSCLEKPPYSELFGNHLLPHLAPDKLRLAKHSGAQLSTAVHCNAAQQCAVVHILWWAVVKI